MEAWVNYSFHELMALFIFNNVSRYLVVAGMTYLVFWKWGFEKFKGKFLYDVKPSKSDLRREFLYSLSSTMIFLLPTIFAYSIRDLNLNKLYWDISERGMAWYLFSFVLVFFIHDAYFYWTHRLMHHPRFYKTFHRVHHLSTKPSPLAAFAFHPLEAIVESLIFVIISFTIPVHFTVLVAFTLFSLFMNVYGHLGFSLFSEKQLNSFPLNMFGHSTHHSWHHQYHRGNYGFYLQMWDRLMGTWKGGLTLRNRD